MATALGLLQQEIEEEEKKLGKYCRRCNYEGKKVLMNRASIQWVDDQHLKHTTAIALVCRNCRDWRWLPEQEETAKLKSGYMREPRIWTDNKGTKDEETYHTDGVSNLEVADLMKELAIIRDRLSLIKKAIKEANPIGYKRSAFFDWDKFMKIFLEKI